MAASAVDAAVTIDDAEALELADWDRRAYELLDQRDAGEISEDECAAKVRAITTPRIRELLQRRAERRAEQRAVHEAENRRFRALVREFEGEQRRLRLRLLQTPNRQDSRPLVQRPQARTRAHRPRPTRAGPAARPGDDDPHEHDVAGRAPGWGVR